MNDQFISTAIPYVNASPHIGFALELLLADVLARQHRLDQDNVFFLTGSDDNSLKNALAAAAAGIPTAQFVRTNSEQFRQLLTTLNISNDDFLPTSQDQRHAPAVHKLWQACAAAGDLYSADYEGRYCVGCEAFYDDADLLDGRCPEHLTIPEVVAERNYFFRLSRYQESLQRWLDDPGTQIEPLGRRNELLRLLQQPLRDISVSRSHGRARGWGIPVPGDPSQVVYVWFDALANYISALGYANDHATQFNQYWQHAHSISHVIGKGVLRFHGVYWPAILLSAGLRLPTQLLVHGYITSDGAKISKSLGNGIDPTAAASIYGVDALRYYLLRHVGSHNDGDFSFTRFGEVYSSELANQLGNLVSRVCALGQRNGYRLTGSATAEQLTTTGLNPDLPRHTRSHNVAFRPQRALVAIWQTIDSANAYVSQQEPWHLARQGNTQQLTQVLAVLYSTLNDIATALAPLLPVTSAAIQRALRSDQKPLPLFPKSS